MTQDELKRRTKQFALRVMRMTDSLPRSTLEEADESALWLELIEEDGLPPRAKLGALLQEANELTAIFGAMHKSSKSSPKSEIRNQKS